MEEKQYRIVVVDDDAICLRNAKNMLSGDRIRVSSVRSGKELLTFLLKHEPDLILLDVMMPEMDGFETYEKLREFETEEGRRQVPVIFLTAENDSKTENRGLKLGASDFVRKPIDKDILLTRIENIIAQTETIEILTEEALTDSLTGFYNKTWATEKMEEVCQTGGGMLMILDLDNFKLINDLYGHDMGDQVLKAFADVARRSTREEDILCRIGGDEFLAFLRSHASESSAGALTERLNTRLTDACRELMGEEFDIPIGVSVGGVAVPRLGGLYEELFSQADKALYQVKQSGKHGCHIHTEEYVLSDIGTRGDPEEELSRFLQIYEERNDVGEAMLVGQEAFTSIYRYTVRFSARHKQDVCTLYFALFEKEEGGSSDRIEAASDMLRDILTQSFRKNDVITQTGVGAFLLLMPELGKENTELIIQRIYEKWGESGFSHGFEVRYASESRMYS